MFGENRSKLNLNDPVHIKNLKIYYQFESGAPLVDRVDPEIISAMKQTVAYFKAIKITTEENKIQLLEKSVPIWSVTMLEKEKLAQYIMQDASKGKISLEMLKSLFGLSKNTFVSLLTSLNDYCGVEFGGEKYKYYLKLRQDLEDIFKQMLGDNGVFLYPTHPTPGPYHNEPMVKPMNFSYTAIINSLGFPATAIPLGLNKKGIPIGLQVIANHNNDRLCFAVAEELERMSGGWAEP